MASPIMTPREIAKQIADSAIVITPNGISVDGVALVRSIAQAITDAYERAAQTLDDEAGNWRSGLENWHVDDLLYDLAVRVRTLKGER